MIKSVRLLSVLFFLSSTAAVFADDDQADLWFAGFAFAGNAAQTEIAFPITSELIKGNPQDLESALWRQISHNNYPNFKLNRGLASNVKQGDAISIAFMLEWENVSSETVGGKTKLVADLHGQILLFDFTSMKVIGSYPVAVQLNDVLDGPATKKDRIKLIRSLYLGSDGISIFNQVAKQLPQVSVKPSTGNYIQIVAVDFEPKAHETLKQFQADPQEQIARIAGNLGKYLFENVNVSYIPFTKGTAIGSKMAARFANGDIYQLELPVPDYRIYLRVRGYKKVLLGSNNIQSVWGYGAYINMAIKSYDNSKVYLDSPFQFALEKTVIVGTADQDDWSAYQETMFSLLDQTTRQIAAPNKAWLNEWSAGKTTLKQLKNLSGVLARSR